MTDLDYLNKLRETHKKAGEFSVDDMLFIAQRFLDRDLVHVDAVPDANEMRLAREAQVLGT